MPWLLDEDEALYQKLSGLKVGNTRQQIQAISGQTVVKVWYRFPDPEVVANRTYPHLTLDLIDIVPETTREARAFEAVLDYVPVGAEPPAAGMTLTQADLPIPWSLIYQISALSREPLHDRQMQAQLIALFPRTFGFLDMSTVDGTVRRADLAGVARNDRVDEDNKRTFHKVFTVAISSELSLSAAQQVWQVIHAPAIAVTNHDGPYDKIPVVVNQEIK